RNNGTVAKSNKRKRGRTFSPTLVVRVDVFISVLPNQLM
ncbi:MAG: hypothetical protein ACI9TH_001161, partial [Kiritimatiellia bacterium]